MDAKRMGEGSAPRARMRVFVDAPAYIRISDIDYKQHAKIMYILAAIVKVRLATELEARDGLRS
jgi:hypothetical protein